ncbi:ABC transporter substrate-binding protein [Synergistales bacterium]|nr:ABC transporter substrate-binding protein [Synergistales bacterium]
MKTNITKFHLKLLVAIMVMALALGVCGIVSVAVADEASDFPGREVTIIVPYDAGGSSDMISRFIASGLGKALNCTVLVVNKPGGAGSVGMTFVRQSKADGYTICYISTDIMTQKVMNISDIVPEDFAFIGQVAEVPGALTVHVDSPFKTATEFIDYAKKNPGKLTVAVGAVGGAWHTTATVLEEGAGVKLNKVSFSGGGAAAVTPLMGKHVDAAVNGAGEVLSGVNAGSLKILGVMTEERMPSLPDVPTLKEQGVNVVFGGSGAYALPKDAPQPIVDKLSAALSKAVESDEFKDFITQRGMIIRYRNTADTKKAIAEQNEVFFNILSKIDK